MTGVQTCALPICCGYVDAFMLRREVAGRERLFAPAPFHLHEDGDGSFARIADPAAAPATVPATLPTTEDTCRDSELLLAFAVPKETRGSRNTGKTKKNTSRALLVARRVATAVGVVLRFVGRVCIVRPLESPLVWAYYS